MTEAVHTHKPQEVGREGTRVNSNRGAVSTQPHRDRTTLAWVAAVTVTETKPQRPDHLGLGAVVTETRSDHRDWTTLAWGQLWREAVAFLDWAHERAASCTTCRTLWYGVVPQAAYGMAKWHDQVASCSLW